MPSPFESSIHITPDILKKIAALDEFKGSWHGSLRLSPQILGRLKASVIITSAGASTRIEGARLSDDQVARLLRGLKTKRPQTRDEQEVAGYADLLGRIFDSYQSLKLTEGQILQLHALLLQYSAKDEHHRGRYKQTDNAVTTKDEEGGQVVLFQPTPPHLVRPEMEALLRWTTATLAERTLHPLLIIAAFIFEFLAIHPFFDGNGRLSRALTNLLLLKTGYSYVPYVSLEEIIEQRRADYYLALRASQKHHQTVQADLGPWLTYFLDVLLEQARRAQALMDAAEPEKMLSPRQLLVYQLFAQGETMSISELALRLRGQVPLPTIKQALARLTKLQLLERLGQARSTRYRLRPTTPQ